MPALALALSLWIGGCGGDSSPTPDTPGAAVPDPGAGPGAAPVSSPGAPSQTGDSGPQAAKRPRPPAPEPTGPAVSALPDRAAEAGLVYRNRSGRPTKPTILEANGAGVALLDLERDGDLDAVFGQGLADLASLLTGPGADLEVFAGDGAGHFERRPGPGLDGWWTGLATGDVDGDGDADLVAGGFGGLALLTQDGDGALVAAANLLPGEEQAPDSRLVPHSRLIPGAARAAGRPPRWATSLALFDMDRDGELDLYVGNYLELDPVAPPTEKLGEGALAVPCKWKGHEVYCGPHGMTPQADVLYRGAGGASEGRFVDESAARLAGQRAAFTLAVAPFDADADGDTDLYVANDSVANQLLVNDGSGVFRDEGVSLGVAVNQDGMAEAGMGIAVGDVDRDGRPDLAVTNFSDEPTHLYLRDTNRYRLETFRRGLSAETRRLLSWSAHLEDFDGDGWLELYTANGHVFPQADEPGTGTSYAQPDTLWRLLPGRRVERFTPGGENDLLAEVRGTRGAAVGDVNGDGRPDLVVVHIDAPAGLGLNGMGAEAHRLELRLAGPSERAANSTGHATPRDALGAVVLLRTAGGGLQVREVQTARGFQSASSPWLTLGLGADATYESLEVHWPSGARTALGPGAADRRLWIEEGRGLVRSEDLPTPRPRTRPGANGATSAADATGE